MANIFDTAQYILEKQGEMSTMKLQKLCYYAQAWSLVWDDKELFPEEFEAWTNGPVCRKLFERTKGKFRVNANDETGGDNDLTDEQKDTIDHVLEHYAPHDSQWLSQLTHMEEPWRQARIDVPNGSPSDNIISKESMAIYYGGL